jgi:DNA relaxase NicK
MQSNHSKITTTPEKETSLVQGPLVIGRSLPNITDQSIVTDCSHLTKNEIKTRIDYLNFNIEGLETKDFTNLKNLISNWLNRLSITAITDKPNLKHYHDGQLLFNQNNNCGAIKWNVIKSIFRLELNGFGCACISTDNDYFNLIATIAKDFRVVIRRLDIAVDDFAGKYGIRFVQQAYCKHLYHSKNGLKPKYELKKNSGGRTIIIGSMKSNKHLISYEKGKQKNFEQSHVLYRWVRHEVRLSGTKDYVIPLEAIFNPDKFFVGAYERAHKRIIKNCPARGIKREYIVITDNNLNRKIASARRQYGPTVQLAVDRLGEKVTLNKLSREGKKHQGYPSFISDDDLINMPYRMT